MFLKSAKHGKGPGKASYATPWGVSSGCAWRAGAQETRSHLARIPFREPPLLYEPLVQELGGPRLLQPTDAGLGVRPGHGRPLARSTPRPLMNTASPTWGAGVSMYLEPGARNGQTNERGERPGPESSHPPHGAQYHHDPMPALPAKAQQADASSLGQEPGREEGVAPAREGHLLG